ncbi:hypothetical protein RKD55_003491 [Rossellomorea marisflavi]
MSLFPVGSNLLASWDEDHFVQDVTSSFIERAEVQKRSVIGSNVLRSFGRYQWIISND